MATKNLKAASVLAFERKIDPSDGFMYAGNWSDRDKKDSWKPIVIQEKAVRGTISNRLKTKGEADPAKLDAEVEKANLQRVDVAALPNNCDTLKVYFTLRILGRVGEPSACNDTDYRTKLLNIVRQYKDQHGFSELAQRYTYNLLNGRFLWRNRIGAQEVEIRVHHIENGKILNTWKFDALKHSLRDFDVIKEIKELTATSQLIESGLKGAHPVFFGVEAFVRMSEGQEVYPSQELVLSDNKNKKDKKSKILYEVDGIAAIHSQKIGNAIRTIDTWYEAEEHIGPIAVEPYGAVTTLSRAYRQPRDKSDFYTLFDNWVVYGETPKDLGNQHFVMATLIRGGVFGDSSKE